MDQINKFIQENSFIVLLTAMLGIVGGIIGVVTGWNQFYNALQSKVEISGWVIMLIFLSFISVIIFSNRNKNDESIATKKLIKYEGKVFGIQTVSMDGKEFVRCEFNGTKLVFEGKYPTSINHCKLTDISFTFGEHAEMTLAFLGGLYRDIPSMRPGLDKTFEAIKQGNLPIASPTYNEDKE